MHQDTVRGAHRAAKGRCGALLDTLFIMFVVISLHSLLLLCFLLFDSSAWIMFKQSRSPDPTESLEAHNQP
jgi:hypothetical protein